MKKLIVLGALLSSLSFSTLSLAGDTLPTYRAAVSADAAFPDPERATRPQGVFVPARHIAMVAPGLRKSEVYTLLDVPHFSEGLFGVHKWNYIFNFYTGQGDEFRQCQYQIRYDRHYRVEAAYWRTEECAQAYQRALTDPVPAPQVVTQYVPAPQVEERAVRSYSFNFDFNRDVINNEGHLVIDQAVNDAAKGGFKRIVVTGFTDTVGSREYNDGLAARRAAATVNELAAKLQASGSPLANQTFSRGGRELAVPTEGNVREVRNRRVMIEFY